MNKVQKPSINECYTSSSEPYGVYQDLRLQFFKFVIALEISAY
jgi:hypothetical protein